ncbi:MAG: OpgC domain-containing protein [Ignavibacteriaceae bacterium]
MNDYIVFSAAAFLIFILSPFFFSVDWNSMLPRFLAGYFYEGGGSVFPIFPWAGYVVAGGVLGSYLARNPMIFKSLNFSIYLAAISMTFLVASFGTGYLSSQLYNMTEVNSASISLIFLRIGFVLLLSSIVSFISLKADSIPQFIILIGRNTLLIYVVHLVLIYGSAWNPGLYTFFEKSFTGWITFFFAILMLGLMTIMVLIVHVFNIRNKQLVT